MPRHSPIEPLVHDWNATAGMPATRVEVLDETLRDGLQSPSVRQPKLVEKLELLHHMDAVGVDVAKIGMPASSDRVLEDSVELAKEIARSGLRLRAACSARTLPDDVATVARVAERSGARVEAYVFVGSSRIRAAAEDWDLLHVRRLVETAVTAARSAGLDVTFVAEDATRAPPESLRDLVNVALDRGALGICLCDTAGYATPEGAMSLVRFVRDVVREHGTRARIDWHGHDDRGLALACALAAITAGADRVHATALGVGERAGNVALEQLVVNLALFGVPGHRNPSRLAEYCRLAANALGHVVAPQSPVVGRDAFHTATGVHAAAIAKAEQRGDTWLADRLYSAVPASWLGERSTIGVSSVSGASNAAHWLERHDLPRREDLVRAIVMAAKRSDRKFSDDDVWAIVRAHGVAQVAKKASGGG